MVIKEGRAALPAAAVVQRSLQRQRRVRPARAVAAAASQCSDGILEVALRLVQRLATRRPRARRPSSSLLRRETGAPVAPARGPRARPAVPVTPDRRAY